MKKNIGIIYVGTSNVTLPGNKSSFPEAFRLKSRLHYYSSLFNSLEVNSSFYKIPQFSTYEKWALDVPGDFTFTLKLNRDITHAKDLSSDPVYIDQFFQSAAGLGSKKGCLLIQFPGKINLTYFKKVEQLFNQLQGHYEANEWRKAVEFRHESWYISETKELLDEYEASMVLHDFSRVKNSSINRKTDFIYLRFHGPSGDYRDSYNEIFLKGKALEILEYAKQGRDVYVYFNNTMGGAYENALFLKSLVQYGENIATMFPVKD